MNLAGLHDIESAAIAPADTWILDTVALSDNPPGRSYPIHLNVITRLNWGYGSTGTLPVADQYEMFAQRVAQYVSRSSGCRRWQIGNETNLRREWPDQIPIYPWHYTAAYRLCRKAIRALPGHEHDEVLIAGTGPWNDECKYPDNHNGDWITYFRDVVELLNGELDGCSIHAYTHGYDPALVTSTARMDAPFHNRFYNFRCYQDYCDAIPLELAHLPVYLTEANGDGPWQATGLMPAMLAEINDWNYSQQPKIHCVVFYRYPKYDHFYIEGRDDVLNEYRNAVGIGYQSPDAGTPPIDPPWQPEPEPEPTPEPERDIDPELIARGVTFEFVSPPAAGTPWVGYWRIVKAEWLDEQEADAAGPDHHILGKIVRDGVEAAGVPLRVGWPSGDTTFYSKSDQPNASYNYDFPMTASLNEFNIRVDDGSPSDAAGGIGMGANGNPGIHTSTWIDFVWTIAQSEPGDQSPPHTEYVTAVAGANLRAAPVDGLILATLPYRTACTVVNETATQSDGYMWHGVNYLSHYGFIRSDLLSVTQPAVILPPIMPPDPTDLILIWPVQKGIVTQWWGDRSIDYSRWGIDSHDGIDIALATGSPVVSVCHGKVVAVGDDEGGFGLYVRIFHEAHGFHSLYGHLSRQTVHVGELVTRGRVIGEVGSTGNSSGPHLHLSFRVGAENDYWRVHTGHKQGASDPMAIYAVVNRSDPNLLLP